MAKAVWCLVGDQPVSPADMLQQLAQLPDLQFLSLCQKKELAHDFAHAAGFASMGFPVGRDDLSGIYKVRAIFMFDIARAMRRQGLPVSSSRQYYDAQGRKRESLVFRLSRLVASHVRMRHPRGHRVPMKIPKDPYRALKFSESITCR